MDSSRFITWLIGWIIAAGLGAILFASHVANTRTPVPEESKLSEQNASADHGENRKSTQTEQARSDDVPTVVQRSEAQVYRPDCTKPEDHDAADYCQQEKMARSAWWQAGIGVFGALLVFAGLVYTARMTAISRHTLVASARAWMVTNVETDGDFIVDPVSGLGLPIKMLNKNIGKTPALNVRTHVSIVEGWPVMGSDPVQEGFRKLKEANIDVDAVAAARLVIPGESYERLWFASTDRSYRVESLLIFPRLLVLITYNVLHESKPRHTGFVYHISRRGGLIDGIGITVPQSDLVLTVDSGGFAE